MMTVRCILVETTVPVRIRPRMETRPVKGHFLSVVIKVSDSVSVENVMLRVQLVVLAMSIRVLCPPLPSTPVVDSSQSADLRNPSLFRRLLARTDVAALNGGLGGTETQTNVLVPSSSALARSGALGLGLGVQEDVRLLLESTLRLDGQFGRPGVTVSKRTSSSADRYGAALAGKTDILDRKSVV